MASFPASPSAATPLALVVGKAINTATLVRNLLVSYYLVHPYL